MPEMTDYPSGTFCWSELATSDAEAAKRFYGELLEWDHVDSPAGPDMVYTMLQRGGKNVGALYQLREEQHGRGVRPRWLSYVSVADVDATSEKAGSLGAKLLQEPFDVFDVGRMATVEDPTGAAFALWQPRQHIGAELVNEPGALCWNELLTRDVPAAAAFYTELFGWTSQEQEMGDMPYTTFMNGERPAGGLLPIQPEWGEVPPLANPPA